MAWNSWNTLEEYLSELSDDGQIDTEVEEQTGSDQWTADSIKAALTAYVTFGSYRKASKMTGVPFPTIHRWSHDPRFAQVIAEAQRKHAKQSSIKTEVLLRVALEKTAINLISGEERQTSDGTVIRLQPSLRDTTSAVKVLAEQARAHAQWADQGSSLSPVQVSHEAQAALEREWLKLREREEQLKEQAKLEQDVQGQGLGSQAHVQGGGGPLSHPPTCRLDSDDPTPGASCEGGTEQGPDPEKEKL